MLPTSSSLSNVADLGTISSSYDYYADGRQRHAYAPLDDRFDRLLEFDHVGRLKEAYSGREARGLTPTNPADSPYRQSFQYNAFGDRTQKSGRFWRTNQSGTTPCTPRQTNDGCDAEGNALYTGGYHFYDAEERQVSFEDWDYPVGGTPNHPQQLPGAQIEQSYDGNGQSARRVETRRSQTLINGGPNANITETTTTTYYIYSSVLSGAKVVELDGNGNKTSGYVYANGIRLAKQTIKPTSNTVTWHHSNPGTNSWVETDTERAPAFEQMDPDGAEVGIEDPWTYVDVPATYENLKKEEPLYIDGGDPFDYISGFTLDGMPMTRSQLDRIVGKLGGSSFLVFDVMQGVRVFDSLNRAWVWPIGTISIDLQKKKKRPWKNLQMPRIEVPFNEAAIQASVLKAIDTPACQDFAKTILDSLATKRKGLGTLMDVAKSFFALPGSHFTRNAPPYSSLKISSPIGRIANRTAQIYSAGDFSKTSQEQLDNDVNNALGELFHLVAEGPYYTDEDLARALFESPYAADANREISPGKKLIDPRSNPFDPDYVPQKGDDPSHKYSRYFHTIQGNYCTPTPGTTKSLGFSPR